MLIGIVLVYFNNDTTCRYCVSIFVVWLAYSSKRNVRILKYMNYATFVLNKGNMFVSISDWGIKILSWTLEIKYSPIKWKAQLILCGFFFKTVFYWLGTNYLAVILGATTITSASYLVRFSPYLIRVAVSYSSIGLFHL
jgi:hypothetical protein